MNFKAKHVDCSKMEKKIVILGNAPINNGNRGCVALSYCAIYLIDQVLGNGNYELFLTDSHEKDGEHVILLPDREIVYKSITIPKVHTIDGLIRMVHNFRQKFYVLHLLKQANVVLDIGEGDSFADIYGNNRFENIDKTHVLARVFKKPYILLPQTIGPFKDNQTRCKAIKSIMNASYVMTRDRQSFDYVKEIAPQQENVQEYNDVAFFLPYKKKKFDDKKPHVGLNISSLLWHGGYTKDNQFGLKCDYQKTIRGIINYFLSLDDVILHLIPHVVMQKRDIENDYAVSFDLCEEYNSEKLILAPFFLTPIDAKSYIAGLDFFMGARMHSTIAAFSSGVPVVPMAYSRKFNGLFIDTLDYDRIADMKEMTDEKILSVISNAYHDRDRLLSIIKERMNDVVEERKTILLDDLKRLLK